MIDISEIFLAIGERLSDKGIRTALGLRVADPEEQAMPLGIVHFGPKPATFDADSNPVETSLMQVTVQYIDQVDLKNPLVDLCRMAKKIDDALFSTSPCSGADTLSGNAINFTKESLDIYQPTSWGRHGIIEFVCNVFFISEEGE